MSTQLTHNSQYGEVMGIGGVVITLTQDAYPAGNIQWPCYRAHGTDADGNGYLIEWPTTEAWDDQQAAYRDGELAADATLIEEDSACDWDNYTVKEC